MGGKKGIYVQIFGRKAGKKETTTKIYMEDNIKMDLRQIGWRWYGLD
jgi:hypothetical protein